ncbi:uncharacterized protein LOC135491982 isoform X2 [Lineus longissimus]
MIDPSQPSPQARALVNNKNNLADMTLRKTLAQVEREKVASITELDHERLEVLDFLRNLKRCDSDRDPTYLKLFKEMTSRRNVTMSALAGMRNDGAEGRRRSRQQRSNSTELEQNVDKELQVEQKDFTQEEDVIRPLASAPPPYRTRFVDPNDAVMTEVMETKSKPKKKEPLSKRIETFFEAVQMYKKAQEDADDDFFTASRMARKWTMMTKGLAESEDDDDDDNNLHTI